MHTPGNVRKAECMVEHTKYTKEKQELMEIQRREMPVVNKSTNNECWQGGGEK